MKRNLCLTVFVFLGTSCGDAQNSDFNANAADPNQQKTAQEANKFPSYAFASKASLPLCSNALSNALAYIKDEKKFYTCDSGTWSEVEIKGDKGTDGKNGTDGSDNKMVGSIYCNGQLQGTSIWFSYSVSLFSSGDVWSAGNIRDSSFEIGSSSFYSAKQVGAATAPVLITNDLLGSANSGFWNLSVNRTTLVTTITNHDSDATGSVNTWTMTADKCTVHNY